MANAALLAVSHVLRRAFLWRALMTKIKRVRVLRFFHLPGSFLSILHHGFNTLIILSLKVDGSFRFQRGALPTRDFLFCRKSRLRAGGMQGIFRLILSLGHKTKTKNGSEDQQALHAYITVGKRNYCSRDANWAIPAPVEPA